MSLSSSRILTITFVTITFLFLVYFSSSNSSPSPTTTTKTSIDTNQQTNKIEQNSKKSSSATKTTNYNMLFSCFYFRGDFYHGRSVPNLDWILVMIESAYEHSNCYSCSSTKSEAVGTRLVIFVDAQTKKQLEDKIISRSTDNEKRRPNFLVENNNKYNNNNFILELILIDEKKDLEFKKLLEENIWANSNEIKNAANNFRFWLIRRYLMKKLQSSFTSLNENKDDNHLHLAKTRIGIIDATDVLFQRNPFETGRCFPKNINQVLFSHDNKNNNNNMKEKNNGLFLFTLEDSSKNFKNERYNRRWMSCYDQINIHNDNDAGDDDVHQSNNNNNNNQKTTITALQSMSKRRMRVSCAGVSFGTFFGLLSYLNAQLEEISKSPQLVTCSKDTIKATLDQATHNYLMFSAEAFLVPSSSSLNTSSSKKKSFASSRGISIWQRAVEKSFLAKKSKRDSSSTTNLVFVAAIPEQQLRQRRNSHEKMQSTTNFDSFGFSSSKTISQQQFNWDENEDCVFHGNFGKLRMMKNNNNVEEEQEVVTRDGNVFAVVHQYTSDRHPKVMREAKRRYQL